MNLLTDGSTAICAMRIRRRKESLVTMRMFYPSSYMTNLMRGPGRASCTPGMPLEPRSTQQILGYGNITALFPNQILISSRVEGAEIRAL